MKRLHNRHPAAWPALFGTASCLLSVVTAAALWAERTPIDLEREEFLRRARIDQTRTISVGVTSPLRATLSLDGRTHDAHIQRVDLAYRRFRTERQTYVNFRDCYKYNIAAYRLDRLLGMNMVPVSVERRFRRKPAALTWWVDDLLMTDAERYRSDIQPPDLASWNDQRDQARVFNQLIYNQDPNLGNFLIDKSWRLWLVDFTRSFNSRRRLLEPQLVRRIDRRLYDGLRALSLEALQREVAPYLSRPQMKAVLQRRDAILELLAARIAARGEAAVVCDLPGH